MPDECQPAVSHRLGETYGELVLFNKCFLLLHRIRADTDD